VHSNAMAAEDKRAKLGRSNNMVSMPLLPSASAPADGDNAEGGGVRIFYGPILI